MSGQQPERGTPDGGSRTPPPQQLSPWYTFIWLSALILVLSTWLQGEQTPGVRGIPYSEFRAAVVEGEVREITLRGDRLRGQFTEAGAERRGGAEATPRFRTIVPPQEDRSLLALLEAHQVTVRAEPTEGPWWQQLLLGVVPWILLLAVFFWLWFYAQRRMMSQGGPGGLFGFGRSRARRFREETPSVTMDQVAGVENAKRDLMEIVQFLRDPGRFRALGAKIPHGVLMVGPPGTGKTLLAPAVAGEAGVTFFSISGSEFIEMFVGVGASRVRDLFQNARKEAPALVFIDELDAIGRTRGAGLGGGHDEREQTLNQILTEMDGFEGHEDVIVLAATNRPDVLDPALLRPGRFDRKVVLDRPHREARRQILAVHTRDVPLAEDVDLDRVAARTIGFAGADLANLVNEAALLAARRGLQQVDADCFEAARDRIVLGERREVSLDEDERRVVAYHECGHALAAWLLPNTDPLEKVTVIPHGQALGVTEQLPDEERYNFRESYLRDRIKVMLGGRAAERVVFDEVSSGAENDLRQATRLVRNMVAKWGMSERLGPLGLNVGDEHVFLGREMAQPRDHSERLAELIDDEVRSLLRELEEATETLLRDQRRALDALAAAVLDRETLSAEEVAEVLAAQTPAAAAGRRPG